MTESQELVSDEHITTPHFSDLTADTPAPVDVASDVVIDVTDLAVYYGKFKAVQNVNMLIRKNVITAFIGP
ncbi:MAG: hypothetical protein JWN99_1811, partial [Ilumatobacteraceae bacterium]|nr:hypothetical protein [Ilumatobacteraceae bacterium]